MSTSEHSVKTLAGSVRVPTIEFGDRLNATLGLALDALTADPMQAAVYLGTLRGMLEATKLFNVAATACPECGEPQKLADIVEDEELVRRTLRRLKAIVRTLHDLGATGSANSVQRSVTELEAALFGDTTDTTSTE